MASLLKEFCHIRLRSVAVISLPHNDNEEVSFTSKDVTVTQCNASKPLVFNFDSCVVSNAVNDKNDEIASEFDSSVGMAILGFNAALLLHDASQTTRNMIDTSTPCMLSSTVSSILEKLFVQLTQQQSSWSEHSSNIAAHTVSVCCFELIDLQLRDLLSEEPMFDTHGRKVVNTYKLRERQNKSIFAEGLTSFQFRSAEQAVAVLTSAINKRCSLVSYTLSDIGLVTSSSLLQLQQLTADTPHCVVGAVGNLFIQIKVQQAFRMKDRNIVVHRESQLEIISIANSETLNYKPQANEIMLCLPVPEVRNFWTIHQAGGKHATSTALTGNLKALSTLTRVVQVMRANIAAGPASKWKHVPFRDSLLTRLLKQSLHGNCYMTVMTVVDARDTDSTLRALKFAGNLSGFYNKIAVNERLSQFIDEPVAPLHKSKSSMGCQTDTDLESSMDSIPNMERDSDLSGAMIDIDGDDEDDDDDDVDTFDAENVLDVSQLTSIQQKASNFATLMGMLQKDMSALSGDLNRLNSAISAPSSSPFDITKLFAADVTRSRPINAADLSTSGVDQNNASISPVSPHKTLSSSDHQVEQFKTFTRTNSASAKGRDARPESPPRQRLQSANRTKTPERGQSTSGHKTPERGASATSRTKTPERAMQHTNSTSSLTRFPSAARLRRTVEGVIPYSRQQQQLQPIMRAKSPATDSNNRHKLSQQDQNISPKTLVAAPPSQGLSRRNLARLENRPHTSSPLKTRPKRHTVTSGTSNNTPSRTSSSRGRSRNHDANQTAAQSPVRRPTSSRPSSRGGSNKKTLPSLSDSTGRAALEQSMEQLSSVIDVPPPVQNAPRRMSFFALHDGLKNSVFTFNRLTSLNSSLIAEVEKDVPTERTSLTSLTSNETDSDREAGERQDVESPLMIKSNIFKSSSATTRHKKVLSFSDQPHHRAHSQSMDLPEIKATITPSENNQRPRALSESDAANTTSTTTKSDVILTTDIPTSTSTAVDSILHVAPSNKQEERSGLERIFLHASSRCDVELVEECLMEGVNVLVRNNFDRDALQLSARNGSIPMLTLLTRHGADLHSVGPHNDTLFHLAASFGHVSTLKWLCERGLSHRAVDCFGQTAVHLAASRCQLNVLKYLNTELCMKFNLFDNEGKSPLECIPTRGGSETEVCRKYVSLVSARERGESR